MKHLKTFESYSGQKLLTYIEKPIKIHLDIEASKHAMDRLYRHGFDNKIEEDDIIDVVEKSIEHLSLSLMKDELNINDDFVIKDKESNLNIACKLYSHNDEFKLVIITVMVKDDFRVRPGQFVLEI